MTTKQKFGRIGVMRFLTAGAVALAAGAAWCADATLGGNGAITIPSMGIEMGARIHGEGWKRNSFSLAERKQRFPDEKGTARWRAMDSYGKDAAHVAHGVVTLTDAGNGAARVKGVVRSDVDQKPECVLWSVDMPAERFIGGSWSDGETTAGLPVKFDGKRMGLYGKKTKTFSVTDKSGARLTFNFDEPVNVVLQDGRRWNDIFTLRLYAGRIPFDKGMKREFDFTFTTSDGVTVKYSKPTIVKAGADWIPVDYRKNIVPGSALDFSNQGLQDAPAGKYGWLKNVNGNFEFENKPGVPQRFYGVNLCMSANTPERELTDEVIARLVRIGYNTIRVHHHEKPLIKDAWKGGQELDPVAMDKFDYLIAKAIESGLYVTTDVYVSREVRWADVGYPEREGVIKEKNVYKCLVAVSDAAFADWCKWAKVFFLHKNPYTGRRYIDEPAMPLLSLINEGQFTMGWGRGAREEPAIQEAYVKWLAEKRAKDPSFAPDAPEQVAQLNFYGVNGNLMAQFMTDVERRSAERMIAFMRSLGSKAMFTNANNGPHPVAMQEVRADLYDYVDNHFYIDHPHFLEKRWALPSKIGNLNPVLNKNLPLTGSAFARLADKPYCITEWNFSGPGMYRGVGGIMTGALSALQNWDGLWRFAYSHSEDGLKEGPCRPGYFDVSTDPLGQASDRASVCLFLRRDLASFKEGTALRVTEESKGGTKLRKGENRAIQVTPAWRDAAWSRLVATAGKTTKAPDGMGELPVTEELYAKDEAPFECKPAKEFSLNRETGAFMIATARTAGGFTPEGSLDCGAVSFTVKGAPATVWASSVDAEPVAIAKSKRILVTHLTDVQANGNVYTDDTKTVLLKWGAAPPVARAGSAEVRIAHDDAGALEVWSLETTGARRARVPSRVEGGKLVFTVEIAAPTAVFNYEVVAK